MSGAYTLFQEIKSKGMNYFNEVVGSQEHGLLDFKTASANSGPMQDGDRKMLAQAISGFANAEGGVIVWGIDCRPGKGKLDPDIARALNPIGNLKRWLSDLQTYTSQHVSPSVDGVQHEIIFDDGKPESDQGFAITYIPQSQGFPVMSTLEHCYYTRSGASFIKMESFMIADRFQRRPQARLELHYTSQLFNITNGDIKLYISFSIKNSGLGLALFPALQIYKNKYIVFDDSKTYTFVRRFTGIQHENDFFAGTVNDVIYPQQVQHIATYSVQNPLRHRWENFKIEYDLYCDGFHQHSCLEKITQEFIDNAIKSPLTIVVKDE